MANDKLRMIPKKNYFILSIIIIVSLLLLYYIHMWSLAYNETKLNMPILDKYLEVINYNELDNYLVEMPNTIIYVSVLENSEIRDFEKKFKNIIKNNELNKDILYMNITDDISNNNIMHEMDNKYSVNNLKMTDVPSIVVFENGNVKSIYNISLNDYDIERVKSFINNINFVDGVNNDD